MNYVNTFIEVADDCKAHEGTAPKVRNGNPTVAELEYSYISESPYQRTQEDVQFFVYSRRSKFSDQQISSNGSRLRDEFFSKPMACMRTSPLAKTYGWGLHFNSGGKVALVSRGTAKYQELAKDPTIIHTHAMRSKRA